MGNHTANVLLCDLYNAISHWLFGLQYPVRTKISTVVLSFGLFTVVLTVADMLSDGWDIYNMWRANPYDISRKWQLCITIILPLPFVVSLARSVFRASLDNAPNVRTNWSHTTDRLIQNEDATLVLSEVQSINADINIPGPKWMNQAYAKRFLEIYPFNMICRCALFLTTWSSQRTTGQDFFNTYSYKKDPKFQLLHLQRAQLDEIKFEAAPQLIIQILLAAMTWVSTGKAPPIWKFGVIFLSFVSISKYFPSVNHLPGMCAFNNCIFSEKDYIKWEELVEQLKPNIYIYLGAFRNFLYIVCRYHLVVVLWLYNWPALLGVTGFQILIIALVLIALHKRDFEEGSEPYIKANIMAFFMEGWYTVGNFLIVPIATTMTHRGIALAFGLQVCTFVVYMAVAVMGWNYDIRVRRYGTSVGTSFAQMHGPLQFNILVTVDVASLVSLPILHFTMEYFWKRMETWKHFTDCKECVGFRKQYCEYRPCWLCEWAWCDEMPSQCHSKLRLIPFVQPFIRKKHKGSDRLFPESDTFTISVEGENVPLLNEQPYYKVQAILRMLGTMEVAADDDFLLCKGHYDCMKSFQTNNNAAVNTPDFSGVVLADVQIRHLPETNMLQLSSIRSSKTWRFEFPFNVYQFLITLYCEPELLNAHMSNQLLFKSHAYTNAIKDAKLQNICWRMAQKMRKQHVSCPRTSCCLLLYPVSDLVELISESGMELSSNLSATEKETLLRAIFPLSLDGTGLDKRAVKFFSTVPSEMDLDTDRSKPATDTEIVSKPVMTNEPIRRDCPLKRQLRRKFYRTFHGTHIFEVQ